ncbi:MAG: outer membrane beta-barrel protein [Alphaproteobacteria bacterium]
MRRIALLFLGFAIVSPAAAQAILDTNSPIGIQAGRFTILPAVETTAVLTHSDAITPGWSLVVSPELRIQTDWGVHSVELFLGTDFSLTDGLALATLAELDLRLDLGALWTLDVGAAYEVAPRSANDAALPDGIDAIPNVRGIGATATMAGPVGNLGLQLDAGFERNLFDDAIVGGIPVDQSERNNTIATAALRLETGAGALLAPFVEANGGRRSYDQLVGTDGFLQASNFVGLRGGITYDSAPVTTAEIGIGAHWELPDDPGLASSRTITIDAGLLWSPREPISFDMSVSTVFTPDASTDWGDSVSRDASIAANWDILRALQLTGFASFGVETYADGTIERSALAGGGVAWSPDRWLRFSASYIHDWLWSPDPLRQGSSGTLALTARVQR